MPQSDPFGTLIVFDFADVADRREELVKSGAMASIHAIIPYLVRSISFRQGLDLLIENDEDEASMECDLNRSVPDLHMLHPTSALSNSSDSSTENPSFIDHASYLEQAVSDDEFE
ncbi:MAG: hypothetical protein M0Z45_06270 [Actinomycetota bacterium]|nr:hypothetical protein [Actinomycetota bacterium]